MTPIAEQIIKYNRSTEKLSQTSSKALSDEEQTDLFLDNINQIRTPIDEIHRMLKSINERLLANFNVMKPDEIDLLVDTAPVMISRSKLVIQHFTTRKVFHFIENCLAEFSREIDHFDEIISDLKKRYKPSSKSDEISKLLGEIASL